MDLFSCLSPFVFCSFASGSSGNCYYVGKQDEGILGIMDLADKYKTMGVRTNADTPDDAKQAVEFGAEGIGLCRTEHMFFAPDRIGPFRRMICSETVEEREEALNEIEPMQPFEICGITVEAFPVLHDGRGAVGYHFNFEGHTLTIATDIGMLDNVVKEQIKRAENIVIESNYDKDMLENGSYPYILKQRISGPFGHLSNAEASRFIAEIYHPNIKNIMLCHLSENNNTPERALQCVYQHFRMKHVRPDVNTSVFPLPRHKDTGFVYL